MTWWDTTAQQEQVATLPAWNLEVEAAAGPAAAEPLVGTPRARPPPPDRRRRSVPDQAPGSARSADSRQGPDQTPRPGPAQPPFYQRPNVYVGLALVLAGSPDCWSCAGAAAAPVALHRRPEAGQRV